MIVRRSIRFFLITGWLGWFSACTTVSPVTDLFRSASPHDQYAQSLKDAKLDRTALGSDWLAAGERALHDTLSIAVPYRESGYFSAGKPFAVGYRMTAQRGDRFLVKVETQGQKTAQVFIDVFALSEKNKPGLIAASRADTNVLSWEPRQNQLYLIRVQPELLRSCNYIISITREPALSFPVKGQDSRQIASYFGAARDGGRRRHEGVDIFAPRGTPAVACVDGIITGVGTNSLGGNVAFLTDSQHGVRLYYAHLDRWNVTNGQRVSVGDTVGFVGNTGNARTISPHLHFGLYNLDGGATDPLPFIRLGRGPARQPLLPATRLGNVVRVTTVRTALRAAPATNATLLRELPKAAAMTIIGGTESWFRIELPDGKTGYVASTATEPVTRPLRRLVLPVPQSLADEANGRAAIIETLPATSTIDVLAGAGLFLLVRKADGVTGWLKADTR